MKKIYFDINEFPGLQLFLDETYPDMRVSESLREIGYISVGYDSQKWKWFMDESEYTLLVLSWDYRKMRNYDSKK